MNNTAYFFCDVDNFEQLQDKTWNAQQMNYKRQKYKVIDTAILNDEQFEKFKKTLTNQWIFFERLHQNYVFRKNANILV
ncbi:MAG: hypothetical protein ACI4S0_12435 [Dorea sp.]